MVKQGRLMTRDMITSLPLCPKCLYRADRRQYHWAHEDQDRALHAARTGSSEIEWVRPEVMDNLPARTPRPNVHAKLNSLPTPPPVPVYDDRSSRPLIPDLRRPLA